MTEPNLKPEVRKPQSRILYLFTRTPLHVRAGASVGAIVLRSASLPALHRDPADRFLIATAQEHHLTLLTPDPAIRHYPRLKTRW